MKLKTTRTRRLGATDAAPLLGLGKWANQRDVYERIVNGVQRPENAAMRRGTKAEPQVLRRYLEETGAELLPMARGTIYEHPAHDWATVSPDGLVVPDTLLELKTASRWVRWNGTPPADYTLQCQWGMWCLGLPRAHLYVAFGEEDVPGGEWVVTSTGLWDFTADAELQSEFLRVGRHFWEFHVEGKRPPSMVAMNGRAQKVEAVP